MTEPIFVDPRDRDAVLIELDSVIAGARLQRRPYHRTREFVRELSAAGVAAAVYCAAGGSTPKLSSTGLTGVFTAVVDGTATTAAERLGLSPNRCVIVDHTVSGVAAAHAAGFGLVLGVAHEGKGEDLLEAGADAVVPDIVTVNVRSGFARVSDMPDALSAYDEFASLAATRRPVVLLDFDGTLSTIVDDPTAAELLPQAADIVRSLVTHCPVAVLSGRSLDDIRARVGVDGLWYGGTHGVELVSPEGVTLQNPMIGGAAAPLRPAMTELTAQLGPVSGVYIEDKQFAIAVHYRNVAPEAVDRVIAVVRNVARGHRLRVTVGRKVVEIGPDVAWDKGQAVNWILNQIDGTDLVLPIYIGDDSTDEDAFDVLRHTGVGIAVRHNVSDIRRSSARFALADPEAVCAFLDRLNDQLSADADGPDDAWMLTFTGYDPHQERLRETLCTNGNGYCGVRGAAPESGAGEFHYPGHYVAGIYNRLTDTVQATSVTNESLVNLPNWLPVTFRINGGDWFDPDRCPPKSYQVTFDLRRALQTRVLTVRDQHGHTTEVIQQRFTSMERPHVSAMRTVVRALDWSGLLELRSSIDGAVTNSGVERYRELSSRHLRVTDMRTLGEDGLVLAVETTQSKIRVALAVKNTLRYDASDGGNHHLRHGPVVGDLTIGHDFAVSIDAGEDVTLDKIAYTYTSRDHGIGEPVDAATGELDRTPDFAELQRGHQLAWAHLWDRFAITVGHDPEVSRIVRLHQVHLLQTLSRHTADLDAGVPARGLHGEAYRGHVFWDELFVFPVTNLRMPEVTRSLLMYRYRRLPAARIAARERGYRGAMFPWQSGSSGSEESQQLHLNPQSGHWNPDPSARAHHVGIAVAYNIWQYYQATGDSGFAVDYGAEMLCEIARFWASLARLDPDRGRYVITGVIGPDEFHSGYPGRHYDGISNNAYTNLMAVWVILRALEGLDRLPLSYRLALLEKLGIDDDELVRWEDVSRRMFVPFHDGVISQFEGYENLRELDWDGYRHRYGNLQRLDRILEAENDSVNNYKAAKQADTLMLFYLLSADELYELFDRLGYAFSPEQIPATINYYRARTSHGSTLSAVVHAWVTARGNRAEAMRYFQQALDSDVVDIQRGTTAEGIHLAAMAGSIDLLQRCFTGLELRGDRIVVGPLWPQALGGLAFPFRYRGHRLRLSVAGRGFTLSAEPGEAGPIVVECRGHCQTLVAGATVRFTQ
ncbi:trehalose-phosphatase [Mycolicibacterium parafortuitum]|uniref:Putative trehalose-6-phosphate phosphatase OtsB1 (Trehalose-phosphatase) (TPP) [Mycobacterium tuberculosis H37Rv] n=1 Tax=Mycolicibacterium parafortuitum TaxID=39692 RepID=A0A375YN74_MYCPF|nr:trehalose-phosphatase [Mycolicibacterium parafortuitum]ORB28662.1 trehalose-phosphatase [Mycolicibacterium parafortuitum]SRX82499.1 putative trehalose-6-phosphate phosphatase OtsB1 (trehalose-phosphatase) (TPP) [Mycobacterium tuberculosis H37Rv] [Mycolicibacterium parafortuitum]